jgi:carboxylate-amine ligase
VTWEIDRLAELAGAPALQAHQLRVDGDRVLLPDGRAVDVLWRRTSEERLVDDDGEPNVLGALLLGPLRAGTVAVVNAFGTGVADDKRTYAYVEDLVRFFTGEEPLLRSQPTADLGDPAQRDAVLPRLEELVLKPRSGSGGHGVLVGPRATPEQLAEVRALVEADPTGWVAQEPVAISTHPTVVDDVLAPRHVDLRPFVLCTGDGPDDTEEDIVVLPGGLTRVALTEGDLVVNCSQGGGAKDTWVV